jgi:hypothetical protein
MQILKEISIAIALLSLLTYGIFWMLHIQPFKNIKIMKNEIKLIMPFLFALLGTGVFIHAVFTNQFDVALPSMIFASFWCILLCKIK